MSQRASVWLATAEPPSFPELSGDVTVDVAVVGGGIAGLTTALMLQRDGAQVAVVEAGLVGAGTTGHTTGKVTSQHALTYASLIDQHGEDKARGYAQANQASIGIIEDLVASTGADCDFERAPAFVYAERPEETERIEAEHAAAVGLGLPATLTTDIDLPISVEAALRFDDQALLHPGRYTAALARTIATGGGKVFQGTRAHAVDEGDDGATVRTRAGDVHAGHVVLATLLPFVDIGGFFAKARPSRSYGIAARLRGGAPEGMHISVGSPARSTRPWIDGGRPGLIVVGESHPTGHGAAGPGKWGALERWAREHFDVESFDYRWSAQDFTTVDELPYVGRSPRMRRTLVATGFRKWGLTNATAAAVVLTDVIAGRDNPWLEVFDATRIGDAATVKRLVEENLHVAKRFVKDWAGRLAAPSVAHLGVGEGGVVALDGRTVGAYRRPDGIVQAVSATCTHRGCTLNWNSAETSWDCPCHGSRFGADGAVLDGPATEALDPVVVDPE